MRVRFAQMLPKASLSLLLAFGFLANGFTQAFPGDEIWGSEIRNMTNRLPTARDLTVHDLPEGYEERVMAELRRRNDYRRLIKLRDEKAIDEYVNFLIHTEARDIRIPSYIATTHSPHFIKHLGPLLLRVDDSESARYLGGEHGSWDDGFTLAIAQGMGGIIVRSTEFSDETREWFTSGQYRSGSDPVGKIRQWWEENEANFESENYHLVRPVSWDLEGKAEEKDPIRDDEPEDNETPLREVPESEETPQPDSEISDENPEVRNFTARIWVLGGIATLAFLAFATFIMRSRRGSS